MKDDIQGHKPNLPLQNRNLFLFQGPPDESTFPVAESASSPVPHSAPQMRLADLDASV